MLCLLALLLDNAPERGNSTDQGASEADEADDDLRLHKITMVHGDRLDASARPVRCNTAPWQYQWQGHLGQAVPS